MTRDPAEGVDADGYLVTGAAVANIPPAYQRVIADCVAALTAYPELDGLYLYGSVATGQARPPDSDLDLLALWTSPADASATAAALSARHAAVVREVGLAEASVDSLSDDADRCFLKHYCVPLAGRDRRDDLPRCRPSRALALGFTGDLPAVLRSIVDTAPTPEVAGSEGGPPAAARGGHDRVGLARRHLEHRPGQRRRAPGRAPSTVDRRGRAGGGDVNRGMGDVTDLLALGNWLVRHPH